MRSRQPQSARLSTLALYLWLVALLAFAERRREQTKRTHCYCAVCYIPIMPQHTPYFLINHLQLHFGLTILARGISVWTAIQFLLKATHTYTVSAKFLTLKYGALTPHASAQLYTRSCMPSFKAPDGKEFATKAEWRDYMMATYYSFKNKHGVTLAKQPGDVDGQGFDIADCDGSSLAVMDACEQVQIDDVKNSRVFIGACASSIFIRNCSKCVFYTSCRQLRLRDVKDCDLYIYSMSEVHIEFSSGVRFAPIIGGYPDHAKHLAATNLDTQRNLWYDVFDHNDPLKTHANWSLIPAANYESPWFPAGVCEVAVPLTSPGGVVGANETSNAGMQSFGFEQLVMDSVSLPLASPAEGSVPPPPTPVSSEKRVEQVLAAFVCFKPGDSLEIFANEFELVGADGVASAARSGLGGTLLAVTKVVVAASSDMAWAAFLVEQAGLVSKCLAVLQLVSDAWVLSAVQQSKAAPLPPVPAPKV